MLTKEQRAHDLAISIISNSLKDKPTEYPNQSEIFEIAKCYEHAYKDILKSFEEKL